MDSVEGNESQRSLNRRGIFPRLVLALVAPVVFFLGVEGILWLAGVRPELDERDPFVGFVSDVPLFVEVVGPDGAVVHETARNKLTHFNRQQFPEQKGSGTFRIFCLGGSTTYGRPYDDTTSFCGWLREFLPVADPSRAWQVVNAGGISYASYRVAAVLEELAHYEPDLFIIYTGHNEFLEERTYREFLDDSEALRFARGMLSRTRTYSGLKRLVGSLTGRQAGPRVTREVFPEEVEAILDASVGPSAYERDDLLRERIVEEFRFNLNRMVDAAEAAGARVVLVTPASNLRHCRPFKSQSSEGLPLENAEAGQGLLRRSMEAVGAGELERALALLDRAIEIDGRFALLEFARGEVLYELGRYEESRGAFVAARDEDVCALRATTALQEVVHALAAERGVPLADFAKFLAGKTPNGIPGEELFLDHVHPTVEGHRLLALELIRVLEAQGIVRPTSEWGSGAIQRVTEAVEAGIDTAMHARALSNLARVIGWAGKHDEAYRLALAGLELAPDDGEALFMAAAKAFRVGRYEESVGFWRRALAAGRDDYETHNNLGNALSHVEAWAEAIGEYERAIEMDAKAAGAHYNLGLALLELGSNRRAEIQLREALRWEPGHAGAHHALGTCLVLQGRLSPGIESFSEALRLDPSRLAALVDRAEAWLDLGRHERAVADYREVLAIAPDWLQVLNNLAWILSTSDDAAVRDGAEALPLARRACALTEHGHLRSLNVLAAASAESGRFQDAAATTRLAIELAESKGREQRATELAARLALYEANRPYRARPD